MERERERERETDCGRDYVMQRREMERNERASVRG